MTYQNMQVILTIISAVFILFVPGFIVSFVFFKSKTIDYIERLALSFALSIAIIPLIVFYTNLLGIKISAVSVIVQVGVVILVSCGILFVQKKQNSRHPGK